MKKNVYKFLQKYNVKVLKKKCNPFKWKISKNMIINVIKMN